jgi:hypothetical protein
MRPVSNGCSGEPGEIPSDEVNAHLGNPVSTSLITVPWGPTEAGAQAIHKIRVSIAPGPENAGRSGAVTVATDHPAQPTIQIGILIPAGDRHPGSELARRSQDAVPALQPSNCSSSSASSGC